MFASDTALDIRKQGCKKEGRSQAALEPKRTIEFFEQCFGRVEHCYASGVRDSH
jgi:hypothetical protein